MQPDAPITVCGVTWYPRANAIESAGERASHIETATSYFYDHIQDGAPSFGHPLSLRRLKASVVFIDDETTHSRVELATHVLCFATIFANSKYSYANATTFDHFVQRIGGDPKISARRTRRMHGASLNGCMIENLIETRPAWCGTYHAPDESVLRALETVTDLPTAEPIHRTLKALMLATQDADAITPAAEHAHYARALERLLQRPGQGRGKKRWDAQHALSIELLDPLLVPLQDLAADRYHIMDARYAASDKRNDFWHPEDTDVVKYAFEKQRVVHPNLIAFRAASALIVATIYSLDAEALDDRLQAFVPTIEEWIGSIKTGDDRPPDEASDIGKLWRHRLLTMQVAKYAAELP